MLALVFTDIIGSTSLQRELGDRDYTQLRRAHFEQARLLIAGTDGYPIKTAGDSFFAVFRTAVEAFDFAVFLHEDTGHERVKIRAGVHVGAVRIEKDGDVFGNAVNYTKRLMDEAKSGGVILSRDAKSQIDFEKAQHHREIVFVPLERELAGFEGKHKLYTAARERPQGLASKIFFGTWLPDTQSLKPHPNVSASGEREQKKIGDK
jgi:adenylate cyclase